MNVATARKRIKALVDQLDDLSADVDREIQDDAHPVMKYTRAYVALHLASMALEEARDILEP